MALTVRSLADGAVPTSTGNLYPASGGIASGKAVIVKNMRFVNKGTSAAATLSVFFTGTGQRNIIPPGLSLLPGMAFIDDQELTLEAGDKIEGLASTSDVEFVISGVERDQ